MTRALVAILVLVGCSSSPKQAPATNTTPPPADPAQPMANTPAGADACPTMQIKAPDSVPAGTQIKVTTTQIGGATPTFNWTLSTGKIASGQGTPNIVVDSTGLAGSTIVATLDLGSLPPECATRGASVSVLVGP